jgi:sRNA-binding protein
MSAGKKRQLSVDAQKQIETLRERWPAAFPAKARDVRPLVGVANKIAAAMGWSNRYAWQVVARWKSWKVYCRAVLWTATRITLEGALAELVDDKERELARARLAKLAARALAREQPGSNREAAREKRETAPPTPSPRQISRTVNTKPASQPQPRSAQPASCTAARF